MTLAADEPAMPVAPATAGDAVVFASRDEYHDTVVELRASGFEMCADLCAVDYLSHPGRRVPAGVAAERFEVVVNLLSLSAKRRVRVRVQVRPDPRGFGPSRATRYQVAARGGWSRRPSRAPSLSR